MMVSVMLAPDPNEPEQIEETLGQLGGLDMCILASGSSNGHVGFNNPGAPRESTTRIVVPSYGVTLGIDTLSRARRSVMFLLGEEKTRAYDSVRGATKYEADWPATIIWECGCPEVCFDAGAAGRITGRREQN
ncbi:MAG: 6-phosphogluconolactonase [Planctomycetaceae bacterium]|nr:6-phosphogluconolactonase [Planctomycetaceae bacterium]